jgi:hypothetical protein
MTAPQHWRPELIMTPVPPPTDPPARRVDVTITPSRYGELERPGLARSRALDAMQASLKRDVGLCGDRCAAAARNALDAGIRAAGRP